MNLTLQEKYESIYAHEEQSSYRLAMEIIKKPEVSVWMVLIPIIFIHHLYKIKQYKAGVRSFAENIMVTKKKALNKAYEEACEGKSIHYEIQDYFPGREFSEQQRILAEKQVDVIRVMEEHYLALLKQPGKTFEAIFKNVYGNRNKYRKHLKKLEEKEQELNAYIKKAIHTSDESREVVKEIERNSKKLRDEELKYLL